MPSSRKLPKKPRRLSGAYSAMNVEAPPYSPPVEKPCTSRKKISRAGAHRPITACEGTSPMAKVPTAIMIMVRERMRLRPTLSPSGPKTMPPSGRTRKATANVAKEPSNWAVSLPEGKKTLPIVDAR
ncbi:hypothetical protein QFZ55_007499 [Streptomyces luteogriseus]|nr:hypothetical protein [Streptomyces luteogriseus]